MGLTAVPLDGDGCSGSNIGASKCRCCCSVNSSRVAVTILRGSDDAAFDPMQQHKAQLQAHNRINSRSVTPNTSQYSVIHSLGAEYHMPWASCSNRFVMSFTYSRAALLLPEFSLLSSYALSLLLLLCSSRWRTSGDAVDAVVADDERTMKNSIDHTTDTTNVFGREQHIVWRTGSMLLRLGFGFL